MPIAPSTYYDHLNRAPSRRQVRDEALKAQIAAGPRRELRRLRCPQGVAGTEP